MRFIKDNTHIDFLGKRNIAIGISLVVIIIGMIAFVFRGKGNLGIDFTGGLLTQVVFSQDLSIDQVRGALKTQTLDNASIQQISENKKMFIIRTPYDSKERLTSALKEGIGEVTFIVEREEMVGPMVGKDLTKKGLWQLYFLF